MSDVFIGKGELAGKAVFANRDFKKGEIVISYQLKAITDKELEDLLNDEKMFVHTHRDVNYLYSEPERYVNHSEEPNTYQDLKKKADIALRDIKKGEMITTDATKDDVGAVPQIIKEVGFDFNWDSKKVWTLDVPTTEMPVSELAWHFDIPFWDSEGTDAYNLTPKEVIAHPEQQPTHWRLIQEADAAYPIDIMENKGRWLILDGLHRLVKEHLAGKTKVKVRKIPRSRIPEIEI